MAEVSELGRKTMVNMFFFVVLKSRSVFKSQELRKQTSRQKFQNAILMFSIWTTVQWNSNHNNSFGKINVTWWSKVVVLFVSALNTMHVGVLRGEYFCNISLGDVLFQKLVLRVSSGFQTRENIWNHEAAGRVVLLFSGV